jgi:hypothetical protein
VVEYRTGERDNPRDSHSFGYRRVPRHLQRDDHHYRDGRFEPAFDTCVPYRNARIHCLRGEL